MGRSIQTLPFDEGQSCPNVESLSSGASGLVSNIDPADEANSGEGRRCGRVAVAHDGWAAANFSCGLLDVA
jgi:hypothetical protein